MQTELERRLWNRRQTEDVIQHSYAGRQSDGRAQGYAQPGLDSGPEPVKARAGERDAPRHSSTI
jgi:hypothetical protein